MGSNGPIPKPDRAAQRQAERRLRAKLHAAWSRIVRARGGGRCAWCGSTNRVQAHHIVSRALCSDAARYDTRNGMPLCYACHLYRLKRDPDGYCEARDRYLAGRQDHADYLTVRAWFGKRGSRQLTAWELSALLEHLRSVETGG